MVTARNVAAVAAFAVPVVVLTACSPPNENASTATVTQPPAVWTGSTAPAQSGQPSPAQHLNATLRAADGTDVATAAFDYANGFFTITVKTSTGGQLTPGFHGMHIHTVGKCEPDSRATPDGPKGNFLSAGGHLQVNGHDTEPASGDLTSLQVREDGSALLVTTTDAFAVEDLIGGEGTAIIIHKDPDNFAHIPEDRYTQVNGAPGPDHTTLTTGDAGQRAACGVITLG